MKNVNSVCTIWRTVAPVKRRWRHISLNQVPEWFHVTYILYLFYFIHNRASFFFSFSEPPPPSPIPTHTLLHIICVTIIIEFPQTFPNLGPKMKLSSIFPDLEKGTSVLPNFPKTVQTMWRLRTTHEKYHIPRMAPGKLVRWTQGSCWSDAGCQGPPSTCSTEINTRALLSLAWRVHGGAEAG